MALDWGVGQYEQTAAELAPVAALVVGRADIEAGTRALDLGCGTGNAALELARAGAITTAIDPAARLVEVARQRAEAAGLTIDLRVGDAAAIPVADGSIDRIVSVFAVIFAPDAAAALTEVKRVLAPGGRILLTAWVPGEGIGKKHAALRAYLGDELGQPSAAPPFPWHDRTALEAIAEPLGLSVDAVEEESIAFTAPSPEAQVDDDLANHPMWIETLANVTSAGGDVAALRERLVATVHDINEDPAAFRTTSRYVVITLR
jgi:SAM-dependent methyltransferase